MAQYKHLPIYKTTYELLEVVLRHANAYKERKKFAKHLGVRGAWFDGKLTKLVKGTGSCS
jgi:hypothetical protein